MTDWNNSQSMVSKHFSVGECLFLHQWNRLANESDGYDSSALESFCQILDQVRDFLGAPMKVHCMFRSPEYNVVIGAPSHDAHSQSIAVDFDCLPSMTCDEVKAKLLPVLERFGLRMEDNGIGASWVHLDCRPVKNARFFKP